MQTSPMSAPAGAWWLLTQMPASCVLAGNTPCRSVWYVGYHKGPPVKRGGRPRPTDKHSLLGCEYHTPPT